MLLVFMSMYVRGHGVTVYIESRTSYLVRSWSLSDIQIRVNSESASK